MKRTIGAIIFMMMLNFCYGQSDTIFYDKDWKLCSRANANFYRLIQKEGKTSYIVTDYFLSTDKPQMIARFTTLDPERKNGHAVFFYADGRKESEGNYIDNSEIATWVYWDEKGTDSSVCDYSDGKAKWIYESEAHKKIVKVEDQPYSSVGEMPQFPGGEAAMMKFINENIRYPNSARENNIQGKVVLQFVVAEDGTLTDIKILQDVGGGCSEESIRVVKLMPKWKPGIEDGVPVPVYFNLPVSFKLGSGKKKSGN